MARNTFTRGPRRGQSGKAPLDNNRAVLMMAALAPMASVSGEAYERRDEGRATWLHLSSNIRSMPVTFTTSHLEDSLAIFRQYKKLAEGAMAQVTDAELTVVLDGEMNSIALIVKHMAGNMRSRWTDFLISDGEKPDRNRDSEFVEPAATRAELMAAWESGWDFVWRALGPLSEADLGRTVTIRGEPHSVMQAINRQVAHYAYHIGQIVMLAKHFRSEEWRTLSMPKRK